MFQTVALITFSISRIDIQAPILGIRYDGQVPVIVQLQPCWCPLTLTELLGAPRA